MGSALTRPVVLILATLDYWLPCQQRIGSIATGCACLARYIFSKEDKEIICRPYKPRKHAPLCDQSLLLFSQVLIPFYKVLQVLGPVRSCDEVSVWTHHGSAAEQTIGVCLRYDITMLVEVMQ